MKYCTVCKKFAVALSIDNTIICVAAGHKFIDKTFEDLYREAMPND